MIPRIFVTIAENNLGFLKVCIVFSYHLRNREQKN